jgi:DNA polymerase V
MAHYMEWSTRVYNVYLKYIAPSDVHNYSIDEVLMDVTNYLDTYKLSARQLAVKIIQDVLETTGITATAGIGTNLYLCKIAMDIWAKHVQPDANGVRIAELDEMSYRRNLWDHRPLTDFWRVGGGYAKKLEANGLYTMGDIARCSLGGPGDYHNEDLLYKLFGVNAETLIDHAWGWEPVTIADVKAYKPESKSIGSGQVLQYPYGYDKARLVVREMADQLALDLVDKKLVTDQLVLTVGYDIENLKGVYQGEVTTDRYGRAIPKHAHGTANMEEYTASTRRIVTAALELFDRIIDRSLLVRRFYLTATRVADERSAPDKKAFEQMDLFTDYAASQERKAEESAELEREKKVQRTMLDIKRRFGKNAILKGMNLEEGATAKERNNMIGGHRSGEV